ncbi:MAG: SDR family NAD(P)-dependent oxidoreductase [Spirochaetales bacterium]|nr:SDR family NAD(P)-dependent oxidoreductase [Spirochaetales bacterium]
MKKVLITGASGFIGSHTAAAFLAQGYSVIAQYRSDNPPVRLTRLESPSCILAQCDLTDKNAAANLLAGVDSVVHLAGLAGHFGPYRHFYRANVLSTRNLADAAKATGVKTFVHISSTVVHGFRNHIDTVENGPYYPLISSYQKTKKLAEDYVIGLNSSRMKTCALRPGNVYGPDDTTMMYDYFDQIMKGFLPLVAGGKSLTCPVYVSDMADAILLALEKPVSAGQVYNITSGEKVTWKEILDYACLYLNKKPLKFSVPYWPGRCLAFLASNAARLFRINSKFVPTRYLIDQGGLNYHFSVQKAARELSYKPMVMISEGMEKTVKAYLSSKTEKSES